LIALSFQKFWKMMLGVSACHTATEISH